MSKLTKHHIKRYSNTYTKHNNTTNKHKQLTDYSNRNKFRNITRDKQQQIPHRKARKGGLAEGSRNLQRSAGQDSGWQLNWLHIIRSNGLLGAEVAPDHQSGSTFSEQRTQTQTQNVISIRTQTQTASRTQPQPNNINTSTTNQHNKETTHNTTTQNTSQNPQTIATPTTHLNTNQPNTTQNNTLDNNTHNNPNTSQQQQQQQIALHKCGTFCGSVGQPRETSGDPSTAASCNQQFRN